MAASDPTTDVPTPTGTLQGVAGFSWDGTNWQPSGRAGPSVATPTGVLRGVAAFNGGPAWQPAGRAQPGVATPTGVLDGVAVYTWSGAAWTPPGGQPAPSTPSGALRGVAAFNWDGAAWQPAAWAGPSVATPYGVLDGVAMFGWSGSAWAAVGAPSLSLDFTSGTLDPRITFSRASTATYFDASGTMQTAASGAPRFDYDPVTLTRRGLLIEEARTNSAVQSGDFTNAAWTKNACAVTRPGGGAPDGTSLNLITEDTSSAAHAFYGGAINYTAATWTASAFVRAGTQRYISLRGEDLGGGNWPWITFDTQTQTINANASVGASGFTALPGGTYRIWLAWNASAILGNVVLGGSNIATAPPTTSSLGTSYVGTSQTWYAWGLQAELGSFPTSLIPTAGAAAARAADVASMPTSPWFNSSAGSVEVEVLLPANNNVGFRGLCCLDGGVANVYTRIFTNNGNAALLAGVNTTNLTVGTMTPGTAFKIAETYGAAGTTTAMSGVLGPTTAVVSTPATYTELRLGSADFTPANFANGYLRRLSYWPRVLSNAEMQAVTT